MGGSDLRVAAARAKARVVPAVMRWLEKLALTLGALPGRVSALARPGVSRVGGADLGGGVQRALAAAGHAFQSPRKPEERIASCQEALERARRDGNSKQEITRLGKLAAVYRREERLSDATVCYSHAVRLSRELGDARLEALALNGLGLTFTAQGAKDRAARAYREAAEAARRAGDRVVEGKVLANLSRRSAA
jgi:tetratricopeptide (TPR) repeat protein